MSLSDMNEGERFTELAGLIVRKAFDPKIGKPKDGQPGKMRQGIVLTDGSTEMGFTLWGQDVGQIMKGDVLTLKAGWINAYDSQRGRKLDLRLRKEGSWVKTGSGAAIPQAPSQAVAPKPEPQYVPVGSPGVPPPQTQWQQPSPVVMVEAEERERRIVRQSSLKVAGQILSSVTVVDADVDVGAESLISLARPLYRWAMGYGSHWMEDENSRKRFWAKLGEAGMDSKDAHRELCIYSMYDFEGTEAEALGILTGAATRKPPEPQLVTSAGASPSVPSGTTTATAKQKHLSGYIRELLGAAGDNAGALGNTITQMAKGWDVDTTTGKTPVLDRLNTTQLTELKDILVALVPGAKEFIPYVEPLGDDMPF